MISGFMYHAAILDALSGAIDFDSDRFRVMLVGKAYAPDPTHAKLSDIAGDALAAAGVDVGVEVVPKGPARTDIELGGATWPASTINATGAIYYRTHGGDDPSDDDLCAFIDFGDEVRCSGGDFALDGMTLALEPRLYDRVRALVASAGTDLIDLGEAVPGFLTLADAGFADGDLVTYGVAGQAGIEIGGGIYRNEPGPGARFSGNEWISCETVLFSTSGAPISFSAGDKVYVDIPIGGDKTYVALGPEPPASLATFLAMIEDDADFLDLFLGAA